MSLWIVRAGKHGEQQATAINEGVVCHAWNELPDYSHCTTKDELASLYKRTYPRESDKQAITGLSQVWRFAREIQKGDWVALPLKTASEIAFGRVVGAYQHKTLAPNVMHIRKVEWFKTVQRSAFPKDILLSMNSALTVFMVSRNDAESRVKKILASPDVEDAHETTDTEVDDLADEDVVDLQLTARDEILKFIQLNFKDHDLARLVDAVLRAKGYKTAVSPPGPDGGVDILAGSGPLGFDRPRICVQVKSGNTPEGQKTFNELCGVVSKFSAEQGLLVSWSGFTNPVKQDARKDFFKIRLWDQGDLVDAILENYEQLDEQIKGELPLKRIWILVDDDSP